jgi:ubiquinone/menaquinone biosynthesis C-methylase UbiE
MYRVLKPGGRALIQDLRGNASLEEINRHVQGMGLSRLNAYMTRMTFKHTLLKNAYTKAEIEQMAAQTDFAKCTVKENTIGMDIWLEK